MARRSAQRTFPRAFPVADLRGYTAFVELQLVARRPGEARPPVRHPAADRLAAMIFATVQ